MLPDRSFFNRLAEAARAETLPRFRSGLDVTNKLSSGFDPVTEGDRAAELAIRALIEENFPTTAFSARNMAISGSTANMSG